MKGKVVTLLIIGFLLICSMAYGETFVLPEELERIESEAFAGIHVDEIEFSENITFIANDAFKEASFVGRGAPGIYAEEWCLSHGFGYEPYSTSINDFAWEETSEGISITRYTGEEDWIVIPETIENQYVVEIAPSALQGNESLRKVYLPRCLLRIGHHAFSGCNSLQSINMPDNIEEIGEYAFYQCQQLNRVHLSDNLSTIPQYAFSQCIKLKEITIPDSVVVIDKFAFYQCTGLLDVQFSANLDTINESAFQECAALKSVDLPDSLSFLGWRAFRECSSLIHFGYPKNIITVEGVFLYGCNSLKEVTVPEGVYKLMDFFIANAGAVEIVNLPSSLKEIGKYSFAYENAFTTLRLPDSVTQIDDHAFYQCSNMKSIFLSNNLEKIEEAAFQECISLEEITFPDKLERIEKAAFRECAALTEIDFPESLKFLGHLSFKGCTSLIRFGYPLGIEEVGGTVFPGCTSLVEITVPEGVTRLMDYFVCNQGTVKRINLPSTLVEIGEYAFYGEDNCFTQINLPDGLKEIGNYAFQKNKSLNAIKLPDSVIYIGDYAFEECTGFLAMSLPAELIQIGKGCFSNCSSLRNVTFNDKLKYIGFNAFENCTTLRSAELPDTVESIGGSAFRNCKNLYSFHYPINLKQTSGDHYGIGIDSIFHGCESLRSVVVTEGTTVIPNGVFYDANYLKDVQLPSTLKSIHKFAFGKCVRIEEMTFPDGLEELRACAFSGCTSLRMASLPDTVYGIGEQAFDGCRNLTSFHYPQNLQRLISLYDNGNLYEGNVLRNCEKIKSIEIPSGVTKIPDLMFQGCNYLETVIIPESVNAIGDSNLFWNDGSVFKDCIALEKLYISPNVTSIGDDVFEGCTNLTVWCEYGSTILQYCKDNGVAYYYLTPDGVNNPSGTLYKGDSYGLHGYARASIPLTEVTATIWNNDKSQALQTISVNPDVTDYSLTDEINYHLIFGTLPLGTYHYTLYASTDLSEETWADTTFKIVPQPLRIYISNLSLPYGLDSTDYSIGGTIVSNYSITQVKVTVYRPDSDEVVKNVTVSPNSSTYNLSALNGQLSLASYTNETLSLKIFATSNGETRTLKDTDLTLRTSANIVLNERKNQTLIDFASDSENRSIFTSQYVDAVIDDMSWVEDDIMLVDNVLSISIFERLENLLIYNGNRQDLIELYKKEIVQLIEDGAYEQFNIAGTASKYSKDILSFLKSEGKLTKEVFKDFKNTKMENYIGSANKLIGAVKDGISTAKDLEEAYETIATICGNFEAGLYLLEYIGSSANVSSQSEFNEAMNILRTEYVSAKAAILYEHLKIIQDLIIEYGEDKIKDALTDLLSTNFGLDFSIAMPKMFAKLTMKATGLDEVASTYKKLFVRQDLLNVANNSYKQAFDRVHNDDHSDEALLKLATAISITKAAWVRANDLITKLPRYAYTIGNEYLDYRYNGRISILLTSSDFD